MSATILASRAFVTGNGPPPAAELSVPPDGHRSSGRSGRETLDQSPHVGRLPGMLQIVVHHADQALAERYRWIPRGVDDPVEFRFVEGGDVGDGAVMDGVVVADEKLRR